MRFNLKIKYNFKIFNNYKQYLSGIKQMIFKQFRYYILGTVVLIKKKIFKTRRVLKKIWNTHIKEFLKDKWYLFLDFLVDCIKLPWFVIKNFFMQNLVINLFIITLYVSIGYFVSDEDLHKTLNGIIIAIFTALNLTNSCTSYYAVKNQNKVSKAYIIEILKILNHLIDELNYFRIFGFANKICHASNSNSKYINIKDSKSVKILLDIFYKLFDDSTYNNIGMFLFYYSFVRFMEENFDSINDLGNKFSLGIMPLIQNCNTKICLIHLQRVCTSLINKYLTLCKFGNSEEIKNLYNQYTNICQSPFKENEDLEEWNQRKDTSIMQLITTYQFNYKESIQWNFKFDDIRQDLLLLIEISKIIYPEFVKVANIKKKK